MIKTFKFSIGAIVAMLALFGMFSQVSAMTTSAGTSTQASGCVSGAKYNTITGALCADATMNPPALGVLPVGCDLGVGTVYSPETGESCSIGGTTITPPIVMMPPWDMYGCKAGSPYSMTTGNKCVGFTVTSSATGSTSSSSTTPLPPGYDCTVAKNAQCANISSTTDVAGIQVALNKILGSKLQAQLSTDGKMGARTRAAIKLFQLQAGITADGKVGPITLAKLRASAY